MSKYLINILIICHLVCAGPILADKHSTDEADEVRIYRSPEERREAGLGRKLNDWLTLSGLLEVEKNYIEENFSNGIKDKINDRPTANIQLGFDISITDWLSAELILESEYDFEARGNENELHIIWDEAFIEASIGEWGIKVGRQYYPFGEYYSHFITGPLLEFGETRGTGVIVDYSFNDFIEWSVFVLESNSDELSDSEEFDWGSSIELVSSDESIRLGIGYLSDLSESDQRFLAGNNDRYESRVSAWNAYFLHGFSDFEMTAEFVKASTSFKELEDNENKPFAYNLELAYFLSSQFQLAVRFEHSNEFTEEARNQYGLSMTWAPSGNLTFSTEYLRGKFENEFVFDEDNGELQNRDIIAVELTAEF